jgi:nitrogen PTS system EIIA component
MIGKLMLRSVDNRADARPQGYQPMYHPMNLGDLLAVDGVIPLLRAKDKKSALVELSARAADVTGLEARLIHDALVQRENLGSTGLGRGIAIPHVKLRALQTITCLFARLEQPIPFDSLDNEPVDLIFVLLAPEHASGDHLKALARISRVLRDPKALDRLRTAKDRASLLAILTETAASHAA